MQQPSTSIELPQFTSIAAVALNIARSCAGWRDSGSGEDFVTYFSHAPRHSGDEHSLRATLIREKILPVFHYAPADIEYESQERYDLSLWVQSGLDRRRIAIVETKSSSIQNLASTKKGPETPVEQLERYLSQAGLYLGVLTNGDEWHLFDFAVGREPLASFSLVELTRLLHDASDVEVATQRLAAQSHLQQALVLTFYYLNAQRWQQTDVFRENIANPAYHRIASLQQPAHVETLVSQIKLVLGSLRETIRAQFALLQERYADYQQQCQFTSLKDNRLYADVLSSAIERVVQSSTTLQFVTERDLHSAYRTLLASLTEQFLEDGDIAAFKSEYLRQAKDLMANYSINQPTLMGETTKPAVKLRPPTDGLDELEELLQIHYTYLQSLAEEFALSKQAVESYLTWQTSVHDIFSNPVSEFCLQTAYIAFVRLFFVRVCEDHNLIPRRISDGPFTRFEQYRIELLTGIKDTYIRLLEETYQRARSVYHNFFGHSELYDWFTLDEYTILALFDLLNRFDFQGISADVLGRVYNEGYIETKARSERGQFYTPPQVVDYMLDSIGIPGRDEADDIRARAFLEKSVGDLSCGSGTFLVAAAARKSAILQRLVATGEVNADYALQILTETFLGFDLNPFACYLAEINLLVQCLPFLLDIQERLCRSIHRFHIYSTDSLEPTRAEQTSAYIFGEATNRLVLFPPSTHKHVLSEDERNIISIKHTKGIPADITGFHSGEKGLDYLLGNPPYVSAGESAENLPYRQAVWEYGIYHLLHQRWDLFVPFFERNLQFLRPETGRLGLIVSNGIETEGYAERLRQLLSSQYRLLQIDFFPNLRLFQDAAIENTIVLVENRPPDEEHTVNRRRHLQADCQRYEELPPTPQVASNGQIFRWRYDALLDKSIAQGSIPLCAIVYVGTGIVAQSKEVLDPIINGRRQKLFTLDDVFLPPADNTKRPVDYTDDGVVGDDVDSYYLRRTRYVAYEKYYSQMYRPRHRALFQTPEKLLLGETSGGYYDRSGLFANHSVQVVVSWKALEESGAIEEKGIKTVLRESRQIAGMTNGVAAIAELFDIRYLLGIINSRFSRRYLASNRLEGTREGRIYPDVWKRLPIKVASKDKQLAIAARVDAIQAQYQQLATLPTPATLAVNPAIRYRDVQGYLAQGMLRYTGDVQNTIAEKPTLRDGRLILRRQPLTYLESSDAELLRYLELYLTQLNPKLQGWSWVEARRRMQVPATLKEVQAFMASIDALSQQEAQIRATIENIATEIEDLVAAAYYEPPDEQMMEIIQAKMGNLHNGSLF